ncbi:S-methyl-5'-thioadenosine phosphorylase [Myxococcota bacterium]
MVCTLAVIGGSGICEIPGLAGRCEHRCETPYGAPSHDVLEGRLGDTRLLFLPRHGPGHRIPPHAINYRANVCALKQLGADWLVSLSAVGSMREEILPGQFVVVDQYIDWTRQRINSFFGQDVVAHVALADPVCPILAEHLARTAERAGAVVHQGGTYLCIEGPQFSTRAESLLYRSWGASVIGMTALPEAKLAREAELPYATLALATDYDCWHQTEETVSMDAVFRVMQKNSELALQAISLLAQALPDPTQSPARRALEGALSTRVEHLSPEARERLGWLLGPVLDRRAEPTG